MKSKHKPTSRPKKGKLVLFTGPLFAGKTTKLIATINYYEKFSSVLVVKTKFDNRIDSDHIGTHNGETKRALAFEKSSDFWNWYTSKKRYYDVIFFNEINFFDVGIIEIIKKLIDNGLTVVCDGLLYDWQRNFFLSTKGILDIADKVKHLYAICFSCKGRASFSKRLIASKDLFLIGGHEAYTVACKDCWNNA